MGRHALLCASSSDRWLHCPPSARLCEGYEDKGSDFAAEGTDAHTLCESRLKQALGMNVKDPVEDLSWYNAEMEDCACSYADYVTELLELAKQACADPVVMIEQRVDFSRWVKEGFGTADRIIIADGVMNIVDYKHGKGVEVPAEANPQMMLYALGALEIFDGIAWDYSAPGISFNVITGRITIFKTTLAAMGYPEYFRFLFSPEDLVFGIEPCAIDDGGAQRLPGEITREHYDIKSIDLVRFVYQSCSWKKKLTYRIAGKHYASDSHLICFDLRRAYEIHEGRMKEAERKIDA